jgi:hypothetical protein
MKIQNIPNWEKDDIIALINHDGGVISFTPPKNMPEGCSWEKIQENVV